MNLNSTMAVTQPQTTHIHHLARLQVPYFLLSITLRLLDKLSVLSACTFEGCVILFRSTLPGIANLAVLVVLM